MEAEKIFVVVFVVVFLGFVATRFVKANRKKRGTGGTGGGSNENTHHK